MKTRDASRILHPAKRMKTVLSRRARGPKPTTRFYTRLRRFSALAVFVAMLAATLYSASSASSSHKSSRRLPGFTSNSATAEGTRVLDKKAGGTNIKGAAAEMDRGNTFPFTASWLSPALMPQMAGESVATFASDCVTPKTSFVLGETVCIKHTGAPLSSEVQRRVSWVSPDSVIVRTTDVTADPQSDSYALSTSTTTVLDDGFSSQTVNTRGTWRVNSIAASDATLRASTFFTVSDPAQPATDLSMEVNKLGVSDVGAGGQLAFTLEVTNTGPDSAQSVQFSSAVPANTTFQSITQNSGPAFTCTDPGSGNTGTTTCTRSGLAKDAEATFTVIYQVNSGTSQGTIISNSASVTNSVTEMRPPDNTGRDTAKVGTPSCALSCPADITVQNDDNAPGAIVDFTIPSNSCGSTTASPESGSFFPVGRTAVSVTSSSGGICSFTVTVNDTQVPVIDCPDDITADEDPQTPGYATVNYLPPSVQDNEPGLTANCDWQSGDKFPVGDTLVTCTVTDSSDNTASCTFNVHVNGSNSACSLTCPTDITVDNDAGQCGAIVTYPDATATDCGTVSYSKASGTFFPVGTTTVTVSASGRSCSFTVTVKDAAPPSLTISTVPTNVATVTADATCLVEVPDFRPYVTASDNCPVKIVQDPDVGTIVQSGTHPITITAYDGDPDGAHNTTTVTTTFTVLDVTPPTIALDGPSSLTVECHTSLDDPGATATDGCAGIFPATASNTVNVNVPGTYTITYTATDPSGNAATTPVTRTVNVVDTQAPTITLNGANPMTVECHTTFTDPGATATDGCAGSFPATASGNVDANTPGTYTITYTASDPSNNAATPVTRTVNVVDTQAPTITLNGANPMTVECHTTFTDPGATATDGCAGNVPVTASGSVNVNVPGTYTITYTASDPAGHAATPVTRTVNVVDTTAPTITLNGQNITLWPPNHSYKTVSVTDLVASASDGCDSNIDINDVVISKVTSDETENGNGDGNTNNDIVLAANCKSVQLRSERQGSGNGRVYTITFRATDASGNVKTVTAKVKVPKSQGNGGSAVDDGPNYTVTGNCP